MNRTSRYLLVPIVGAIFGIAILLSAVGLLAAGVATLRARLWGDWRRFTPLSVGVWTTALLGLNSPKALPPGVAIYGLLPAGARHRALHAAVAVAGKHPAAPNPGTRHVSDTSPQSAATTTGDYATAPIEIAPEHRLGRGRILQPVRRAAGWVHLALAAAIVLGVFLQVYLIGSYIFGAGQGALEAGGRQDRVLEVA